MSTNDGSAGVSNCFVFKSQLQEYAQKVGLSTPIYETIKEGPSHEPFFRSTVIVNDVRYDSLPGFFNRKAAEQSAAEVALLELAKYGETSEKISQPVHETGLAKNLLQEYAQKMNHAIPLYECQRDERSGREVLFNSTVEVGGIRYIGAAARTKKEAEIKAARTALLAIKLTENESTGDSQLTVLPSKRKGAETNSSTEHVAKPLQAKKGRFKTKQRKKFGGTKVDGNEAENTGGSENLADGARVKKRRKFNGEKFKFSKNGQRPASDNNQGQNGTPVKKVSSEFHADDTAPLDKENATKLSGVEQKIPVMDNSCTGQANTSSVADGFNQIKTAV